MDPQAQAIVAELQAAARPMPDDQAEWLKGYREELDRIVEMQGPAPEIEVVEERVGNGPLLRCYRPKAGRLPTLLFIHGGGFVAGSLTGYDIPLRHLALRSGWQVAAVAYRLAPEHPYPAAPDDCLAALRHLTEAGSVDPSRLAVGGDSAGGLLATVTARRARDAGIALVLQMMLYPNTDLREDGPHPSRRTYDGIIIRVDELYRSLALYVGGASRTDPDVSPLLADDLDRLCPALVVSNEIDPLRDEAEAYAERLREAGVRVESIRLDGMIHSVMQRGARIDVGDQLISWMAGKLSGVSAAGGRDDSTPDGLPRGSPAIPDRRPARDRS